MLGDNNMSFILDLLILAFILITTFIGYKMGLIKVAFGFLSFIIALIISLLLYKPVSNFITNYTPIPETIETQIEKRISTSNEEEKDNFISNYYNQVKNSSVNVISQSITTSIINIASLLIVFILTRIILLFIRFSGDLIAKLPFIKQFNHIGGFIYGILAGFIVIYIIFTIIAVLAPVVNLNNVINYINSSIIGNIMYNNNIIFMFIV